MNPQERADQAFESWLVDGPTRMPEHLVDSIVTQLEQTHQRKHLWLPGREQMNRMMVAVGGVAAIALLAVAGLYFVGRGGGIGGQATPAATPTLAPAPTVTPAPIPTPTPTPARLTAGGTLQPGRYFVDNQGYRYTFSISGNGWSAYVSGTDVIIQKGNEQGSDFANLWLWGPTTGQMVWGTACAWTGTSFTPGPSVDELASAIAGLTGFQTTQPTAVTVSGYSGKELKLTVPAGVSFGSCPQGEYRSWDGRYYQQTNQTDDVRVLDFDGTRTLIFTTRFAGTPATTLTEQATMFDSLEIAPVPGAAATSTP